MRGYRHAFAEALSRDTFHHPEVKRHFNRKLFDVVALRYDVVTRILSFGWDQRWKRRLLRRIGLRNVRCAVDLATGTGDIARGLARRFPNARVVGVDLSPEMLLRARRLARGKGTRGSPPGNLEFIPGDMGELPFEDASVDLVTGGYALRNAPDLAEVLREVRRVLRPGGRIAFLDFSNSGPLRLRLLAFWGRLWGILLNRNPTTYGYIAESLAEYPCPRRLRELLGSTGFVRPRRLSLLFGFMEIFEAAAPGSREG